MGNEDEARIEGVEHDDKYTLIVLDKPRYLLLDLNAMVDFEKATGKRIWDLGDNISATDLRALLWASLRHEDTLLLPSHVGEMIHMGNLVEVGELLTEMITKNMPEDKKSKKKKPSPLAAEE